MPLWLYIAITAIWFVWSCVEVLAWAGLFRISKYRKVTISRGGLLVSIIWLVVSVLWLCYLAFN
jgi:hypothetical protein